MARIRGTSWFAALEAGDRADRNLAAGSIRPPRYPGADHGVHYYVRLRYAEGILPGAIRREHYYTVLVSFDRLQPYATVIAAAGAAWEAGGIVRGPSDPTGVAPVLIHTSSGVPDATILAVWRG